MSYHVVQDPEQVREVLRRVDDFLPTNALTSVVPLSPAALRILSRARFALPAVLASATGDRHRLVRSVVAGFFTPAKVAAIGPRVRELTRARAEAAAAALAGGPGGQSGGPVDLAGTIAAHIPPVIMQELTGFPLPKPEVLKRWSQDSLELFWGWPDEDRQLDLAHTAAEFYTWLRAEVIASRGGDSLFGALSAAGLSTAEVCSLGYFLLIAGQETTALLIGTALYRALQDPARWGELARGGSAQGLVREVLAAEPSVHTWRRACPADTVLGGTELPAGAEILLELAGHHDAEAGPTAYSLAFGHGLHRCLGAKLAELETVLAVEETARALPGVRPCGPEPEWLRLLSFQAPLTVTVEAP